MGTRAAFWMGDPRDIENRRWLGAKAWDGYPEAFDELMASTTEEEFLDAVADISEARDFASPEGGWPFPWDGDVFLTDFTYAFFNGGVQVSCYHHGFVRGSDVMAEDFDWPAGDDHTLSSIPAPSRYDPSQPDSIIIIRTR